MENRLKIVTVLLSSVSSVFVCAEDSSLLDSPPLSAAEQAALDAHITVEKQEYFLAMCNYQLAYAPEEEKADFIASLEGLTCEEAAQQLHIAEGSEAAAEAAP